MIKLDHVSIRTTKLNDLFLFYKDFFCSEIIHKFISSNGECYGYMLKFSGGGVVELLKSTHENKQLIDINIPLCGIHHFCLKVNDLEVFLTGIPKEYIQYPVKIGRTDFIKQVMIADPDGNLIEIHEVKI